MSNKRVVSVSSLFKPLFFWVVLVLIWSEHVTADWEEQSLWGLGPLLKKNQRATIVSTEYGYVSEARVTDGNEAFQLHFITLEPNSLFLPVLLHSDMVFYVHTGSGRLSYLDEDEKEHRRLRRGDVHRLRSGAVFFIQSDLETVRQKLRIIAIFDNSEYDFNDPASGPYSSVSDLVLGFDKRVLGATFKVPEPVIEEITNGTRPAAIIHGLQKKENKIWDPEYEFMEDMYNIFDFTNKHKKSKLFNIFGEDPDFKNCNGWSTTVNKKKYGPLKGSKYGIFMVNLTTGSTMGPHWNPVATEIAVVLQGKGMIHVVCSRMVNVSECKNSRYEVEEGDVFVIPRFHPMAQMAFNNETFVFMGFSTSIRKNHPQYLAGKASVLLTLDKHILAASLGTDDAAFAKLLAQQDESVILACTSCAEEEWIRMVEEIEKERQREKEREEEEARRKEEEKRRKEEEATKKEEEEAKRREEEAQKKREEEEAQKKREEEEAQRRWEEEERRRREEEERKRQEQAERERQEQQHREQEEKERQEQQRKWEEEERKRQEQQQQEQEERERQEQQQREQEERAAEEREEEQARKAEREREAQARREEEAAKEAEAAAQGQGGTEGQGQWGEGRGEQWPEEKRGLEAEARKEEEAASRQEAAARRWEQVHGSEGRGQEEAGKSSQESAAAKEVQGSGQGWARRILKKTA